MAYPREVLNELFWRDDRDMGSVRLAFIHRGAENDIKVVQGSEIVNLDRSFFHTSTSQVPYHRIVRIWYGNETLYDRDTASRK